MPTDIFQMMIGAPPSTEESQRRTASQLRAQQDFGMIAALSRDPNLTKFGGQMMGQASDRAKGMGLAQAKKVYQDRMFEQQQEQMNRADRRTRESREFTRGENALNRSSTLAAAEARFQQAQEKDVKRYTQALSRDLTKAGIPEINNTIAAVDAALLPYEGKNIPGLGGGKYDPSNEARAMRGKLAGIENILLKARSGAAVTEPEYERFRKELLGEGMLATDADFRRSWADLKSRIAAQEEGIVKGYDIGVQDRYYRSQSTPKGSPDPTIGDAESYF